MRIIWSNQEYRHTAVYDAQVGLRDAIFHSSVRNPTLQLCIDVGLGSTLRLATSNSRFRFCVLNSRGEVCCGGKGVKGDREWEAPSHQNGGRGFHRARRTRSVAILAERCGSYYERRRVAVRTCSILRLVNHTVA
jgi:hypothetical protein